METKKVVDDKNKFNRMFNYFLNYKNCEAEDLEYTNLYLATVKSKNDGVVFEDISQKFYDKHIRQGNRCYMLCLLFLLLVGK